tara:strand:+ start:1226 stop:2275 length:1050 start_codon:yes stop_codon:yes gene_type:complete
MAVTFSGTKLPQSTLAEIQRELYQDSATFKERIIDIQDGFKSGLDVYESKVAVTFSAASTGPVTASGNIAATATRSPVTLDRIEVSDFIDEATLLDTRFEQSMAAGAFNLVSTEFDNAVLVDITPAIGEGMENLTWNGAKAATKASVAGLTAAAPQGSISSGTKTLVAAMPVNLTDSITATIIFNDSQAKDTPGAGLGDYNKVLNIVAITSASIAGEYGKLYATIPSKVLDNKIVGQTAIMFAPLGHRALMKIANNSVGAASNINFLFEGAGAAERAYYNGVEIKFVPLVGFIIACNPKYLKVLMDLTSDMSVLETGQVANGAQQRYYKNVQAYKAFVTNQRYITLYGG